MKDFFKSLGDSKTREKKINSLFEDQISIEFF